MYKAIAAVCSEIHTKHSTQSERHVEFFNFIPWRYVKKPLGFKRLMMGQANAIAASSRILTAVPFKVKAFLDVTLRCCTDRDRRFEGKQYNFGLLDAKDEDITMVEKSGITRPATRRHIPDLDLLRMLFSILTNRLYQVAFSPQCWCCVTPTHQAAFLDRQAMYV